MHHNPHFQNAFNLYGLENFKFNILEICSPEELLKREDWWIEKNNARNADFGYNFKSAERPTLSENARIALSKNRKGEKNPMFGKSLSSTHRDRISQALKGIPRHFSDETKRKMSVSQTGKKLSEITKIKIGIYSKNRIVSDETKKRMSEAQKLYRATHEKQMHSPETKRKMSTYRRGRKLNMSEEGRKVLSDKIKKLNELRRQKSIKSLMCNLK